MGMCTSRNTESHAWEKDAKSTKMFVHKMKLLQQEVNAILKRREEDSETYERELMVFAFKEAEWKRERKKLREEVKRLRRSLEESEERIRQIEDEVDMMAKTDNLEWQSSVESNAATASLLMMEQMREERARRDEAAEKWKMLYLSIKNELDDLIQRTHQGTLYWRAGEEDFTELQRELKEKEETIELLKAQIASMEDEEYKRKREVDILRQSLKIMSNKGTTASKHAKNRPTPSIRLTKSLSKLALVK